MADAADPAGRPALTDAELAQLVADITGMADGWGRATMGWLTMPDAFKLLAPRIISALEGRHADNAALRAALAAAESTEAALYEVCVTVAKALRLEVWGLDELAPAVGRLREQLAAAADKLDFAARLLEDDNNDAGAARSVRKWSRAARGALEGRL